MNPPEYSFDKDGNLALGDGRRLGAFRPIVAHDEDWHIYQLIVQAGREAHRGGANGGIWTWLGQIYGMYIGLCCPK